MDHVQDWRRGVGLKCACKAVVALRAFRGSSGLPASSYSLEAYVAIYLTRGVSALRMIHTIHEREYLDSRTHPSNA